MLLRNYKRIINTKKLPGFDTGYNPAWQISQDTMSAGFGVTGNKTSSWTPNIQPMQGVSVVPTNTPNFRQPSLPSGLQGGAQKSSQYWSNVGKNAIGSLPNILTSGLGTYQSISNAFQYNKSADDLLHEQGTTTGSVNGVSYQKYNTVDSQREMNEVESQNKANTLNAASSGATTGAAIGSVFGPVGGAVGGVVGGIGGLIGGIFGGNKRKREARRRLIEALRKANNTNVFNRNGAFTDSLQQQYELENGNDEDQQLYTADKGKDEGRTITPYGKTTDEPNARVSVGEPILDGLQNTDETRGYIPRTGVPHADDQPANLSESSVVLGSDKDWRNGLTFMEQGQPYTLALEKINKKYENRPNKNINKLRGTMGSQTDELQQQSVNKMKEPIVEKLRDLADQQKYQHEMLNYAEGMKKYNRGKSGLPGFDKGDDQIPKISMWDSFIPNAIGAALSLKQYNDARSLSIRTPDIYAANPYERMALNTLAGLRMNGYPIAQQIREAERRTNYAINNSGGLSGSQKYLGRLANANNAYSNIADMWSSLQEKNNAYRSAYANAALSAGNATAQRRQSANQYNEEYAAKAHAARQQGMQMGMRNFMDYLNNFAASEFKRKQFNGMLGLYQAEMDAKNPNKAKASDSKSNPFVLSGPKTKKATSGSTVDVMPKKVSRTNTASTSTLMNMPVYGTNRTTRGYTATPSEMPTIPSQSSGNPTVPVMGVPTYGYGYVRNTSPFSLDAMPSIPGRSMTNSTLGMIDMPAQRRREGTFGDYDEWMRDLNSYETTHNMFTVPGINDWYFGSRPNSVVFK